MQKMTEREQEVLEFMANGTEPTWIFLKEMPELEDDRHNLERILRGFEERGLVTRTREPSGNPEDTFPDPDDWWALTALGRSAVRE